MATNVLGSGITTEYTNSGTATITSGTLVAFDNICALALVDIAASGTGAVQLCGRISYSAPAGAIAVGDALYFDATNDDVSTTQATGEVYAGTALTSKATAAGTVQLLLNDNTAPSD